MWKMCGICNLIDDFAKTREILPEMLEYSFTDKKKKNWNSSTVDDLFNKWNGDIAKAREKNNPMQVRDVIKAIFEWGGVGSAELLKVYEPKILSNADNDSLAKKHGGNLSSWSKVLAAYDQKNFFIYDSRVAVALNLIYQDQNIRINERFVWFIPTGRSILSQVMKQELKEKEEKATESYSRYLALLKEAIPDDSEWKKRREIEQKLFMLGGYYEFRCSDWMKYIQHKKEK